MVLRNSTPGVFAYIWQSKWVEIVAIKTERTQIDFWSDVLIAVASLDLEVPKDAGDDNENVKKALLFWLESSIFTRPILGVGEHNTKIFSFFSKLSFGPFGFNPIKFHQNLTN